MGRRTGQSIRLHRCSRWYTQAGCDSMKRKGWMTEWITGVDLSTTLSSTVPGFLGKSALAVVRRVALRRRLQSRHLLLSAL